MALLRVLFFCIFLCSLKMLSLDTGVAQELDSTVLPGPPLIESVNLYEIGSYPQLWTVTKDPTGNLLVGTAGNMMLFDGVRWTSYTSPGLAVRSIQPSMDGKLYIGGSSQIGYFEKKGSPLVDSLVYKSMMDKLAPSQEGFGNLNKIIAREDSSLFLNGNRLSFHLKNDSLITLSDDIWIFRLFEAHNSIYTNDSLGVSRYEDDRLSPLPDTEQFEYTAVFCVMEMDDNGLMVAVRDKGLFTHDGSTFTKIEGEVNRFIDNHTPYACLRLRDGSYIAGTLTGGAVRFDIEGNILGLFNEDNGLPENLIYNLYLDVDGTVWLSHMEHVSRLDFGTPVRHIQKGNGIEGMPHTTLKFDGVRYVNSERGLFKIDKVEGTAEKIFPLNSISKMFEANGRLYVHTSRELYAPLESSEPLIEFDSIINKIKPYKRDPSIYITTSDGGVTFIKKVDSSYKESAIITSIDMNNGNIAENRDGDIWVGGNSGNLISISSSEIERFLETGDADVVEHSMPDGWHRDRGYNIYPLLLGEEILLGSPTGLFRFDKETQTVVEDNRFGELSRMNERGTVNPIRRMVADENQNVWIRSSREFQYAEKMDDGSYQIHRNMLHQIPEDQNNAIVAEGDGKVWFVGNAGLFFYDHNYATERFVRPPVVRKVTAAGDSLVYQAYDREKSEENELVLSYDLNNLRIEYAFTDYSTFEGTEYQVKMEGLDNDWLLWNDEPQKDYTGIREGRYQFMVRAKDITGVVSEAAVLNIRILPPWYRTIWAYMFYFIGITGFLYGLHKFRINRILHVQNIRNRIASDLHDEISATLSSISYFSEAIQRSGDDIKSSKYLGLINRGADDAKEKITDIIWSINPENDSWENLLTKCRRYAADLFESKGIEYKINFDKSVSGSADIEARKNIWLIFKEIVTNTARHSNADFVTINFTLNGGYIYLKVSDNGTGFDPESVKEGNGIRNIKSRAEQTGIHHEVISNKDGTTWIIKGNL